MMFPSSSDEISGRWDLMVFFEVMLESGEGARFPDWRV